MNLQPYQYQQLQHSGLPRSQWIDVVNYYRANRGSINAAIKVISHRLTAAGLKPRYQRFIEGGASGQATDPRPVNKRARIEGIRPLNMMANIEDPQRSNYYVKKGGRKVSKRQKLMMNLQTHVQPIIERYGCNRPVGHSDSVVAQGGSVVLSAGGPDLSTTNWPVYLFDMTGVKNTNHKSAAHIMPAVSYRLLADASGSFAYTQQNIGRDFTDSTNKLTWQIEQLARATADYSSIPNVGNQAFIDMFKLKMAVWGARLLPSEVYVELWRFTDDQICPPQVCSSLGAIDTPVTTYTTSVQDRMNNFWTYMLSKQIGTVDSDKLRADDGKGCDIKRLWTFKFNADTSTNQDPSGVQKNLTMTHQFNRYLKLDWGDNVSVENPLSIGNPDSYQPDGTSNTTAPFPNQTSRVFLVVRADVQQKCLTALGHTSQDAVALNLFPSFDFTIRRFRQLVHT